MNETLEDVINDLNRAVDSMTYRDWGHDDAQLRELELCARQLVLTIQQRRLDLER